MTQLSSAKDGIITDEMKTVAAQERLQPEEIRALIASGRVLIPKNLNRNFTPRGIGKRLKTKVNANLGTSGDHFELEDELKKLKAAQDAGADSVMDLSTGGDLAEMRKAIIENSELMVGTVPIYGVATELSRRDMDITVMTADMLFEEIERQCEEGVDFITVHCGVTQRSASFADSSKRVGGIVSRGGSLLSAWIRKNKKENPLYTDYDRLLKIAYKHDVTLSLGDGLRPGAIADATDQAQIEELLIIGELTRKAREKGVQVMVEGPGHVPLNQIKANMQLQQRICDEAPFYVLGPLTTDCAPGYDHITAAIGGAIAAAEGADFLCVVTPAEHLCLPSPEDIYTGVMGTRIAAHSGDIVKGVGGAWEQSLEMSKCRKRLDWEGMFKYALDPEMAKKRREISKGSEKEVCTMCGKLCAVNLHNITA
ncbi:MAG: phosphomethylpyrimidine synthase ThiC [Deltaproteobacteria bacterium]|nr:phosphomethylpyrimidine synthase ThiC [Deltaproteobacteria bacterium]